MKKFKIRVNVLEDGKYVKRAMIVSGAEAKFPEFNDLTFLVYIDPTRKNQWEIWKVSELVTGTSMSYKGWLTAQEALEETQKILAKNLKFNNSDLNKKIFREYQLFGSVNQLLVIDRK
jgi:hypothetical protein